MGKSDGFSGTGILGTITFKIVGELPTSLKVANPTLRGYDGETTVTNNDIYIEFNDGENFQSHYSTLGIHTQIDTKSKLFSFRNAEPEGQYL